MWDPRLLQGGSAASMFDVRRVCQTSNHFSTNIAQIYNIPCFSETDRPVMWTLQQYGDTKHRHRFRGGGHREAQTNTRRMFFKLSISFLSNVAVPRLLSFPTNIMCSHVGCRQAHEHKTKKRKNPPGKRADGKRENESVKSRFDDEHWTDAMKKPACAAEAVRRSKEGKRCAQWGRVCGSGSMWAARAQRESNARRDDSGSPGSSFLPWIPLSQTHVSTFRRCWEVRHTQQPRCQGEESNRQLAGERMDFPEPRTSSEIH